MVAALLAACAGEQAYREGNEMLSQGKVSEGLSKLDQASREAPSNARFRAAFLRERERNMRQLVAMAESLRSVEQFAEADAMYRRALEIDSASEQAQAGLRDTRAEQAQRARLREVQAKLDRKEFDAARDDLRSLLRENPRQREARVLLRRLEGANPAEGPYEMALRPRMAKPVTLQFRDATLRQVLDIMFNHAGISFMLDRDVRPDQRVNIFVRNTKIEDALRLILTTNQLASKVVSSDTILIYPATPAKQREYQELVSRTFYIANADIRQTVNLIRTMVKTRDLFVDEKLNILVMKDSPAAVRYAEQLIALQDLAEPEVMLEVEVLEVATTRLLELGMKWPGSIRYSAVGAAGTAGTITLPEWNNRNASLVRMALTDPMLTLNFNLTEGGTNILANPRIRVKNREKAKIHIGDRVPVITTTSTATGFVAESVSYLDVGLKLDVEPNVYLEDEVGIKIGLEVSNITNTVTSTAGTRTYQVGTRNAATVLRLRDGETQVLAGLINTEDRSTANKVPGLGELPIVGRLFGSTADTLNRTEIVLLITPRILRNMVLPESQSTEFGAGTEAAIGLPLRAVSVPAEVALRSEPITLSLRGSSSLGTSPAAQAAPFPAMPLPGTVLPMGPSPGGSAGAAEAPPTMPVSGPSAAQQGGFMPGATDASGGAGAPGVIALSWSGAAQARTGEPVQVSLMLSAAQPVAGAPVQIVYDPQVLQVTEAREGSFFRQGGEGNFTSRIDGGGNIFVVASRAGGGGVAGSGDIVTLTVVPLKPAARTEIRLGSSSVTAITGQLAQVAPLTPFAMTITP
jgi:general secretion pathway protein D